MRESIAVLMTVHNRRTTTLECLGRFYGCRGIEDYDVDFYMLDDASTDGTAEAVAAAFPQVIILQGDGNLFWNRGMYRCWQEALKEHHDFYLWLNDDTQLFEDALDVLFRDYAAAGVMSIVAGCCCDRETHSRVTYGGRVGNKLVEPDGAVREIECMNGNFVLVPDCVYREIGMNDPYYRHGLADYEYGFRARKKGVKVVVTSAYVAECDRHDEDKKCFDPKFPLKDRFKYLYSVRFDTIGQFHRNWKYLSRIKAIRIILAQHFQALFPRFYS